jgi:hypothetical protein
MRFIHKSFYNLIVFISYNIDKSKMYNHNVNNALHGSNQMLQAMSAQMGSMNMMSMGGMGGTGSTFFYMGNVIGLESKI